MIDGEDGAAKPSAKPTDVADYLTAPPTVGAVGKPVEPQSFRSLLTLKKKKKP